MYLTFQDVTNRLQVGEEFVQNWLRTGVLVGVPLGQSNWQIEEVAFNDFL